VSERQILRGRAIVLDDYVPLADDAPVEPGSRPIVSLERWRAEREALCAHASAVGVRIGCDKLPSDIPDLERLALVAIELPRFTEGRPYSVARLLRTQHGFRGELRAVGNVLRDQLRYLERCGFDAFEVAGSLPLERCLEAFDEHALTYQAAADTPLPHFRRR
jgi:uncharacterized protein (DUF934 family)